MCDFEKTNTGNFNIREVLMGGNQRQDNNVHEVCQKFNFHVPIHL